jgi:Asp-tRNA(Asn)/Glu-tRNA(Gln) amidotransferase A subunit family amidase
MSPENNEQEYRIKPFMIAATETLVGLEFSESHRELMLKGVNENLGKYEEIRALQMPNNVTPALYFDPQLLGMTFNIEEKPIRLSTAQDIEVSDNLEDLAFCSVLTLASLISKQKISSLELTMMYLSRLKRYDPLLNCVITLTEDLALEQARRADEEIKQGKYRGVLHGIPYGVKDLFAYPGYPTTWGAMPYKDQIINQTATVIKRLEKVGAVMIAKLTTGALAWGDVWYKATTKTPWNLEEGSSGSSAGSASATAAGLVAFSIGTETWGSIISPSNRCGTTGLRPTYGRVSRYGVMTVSWSMDKIGPICRTVEDCAIVFDAIYGPDGHDKTLVNLPFNWDTKLNATTLRVGFDQKAFEESEYYEKHPDAKENDASTLEKMRTIGFQLKPINLPDIPTDALSIICFVEAAAAFDELTLTKRDELLVRQEEKAWPNMFRQARLIPAVEYIQANRARYLLIQAMAELFMEIDVYVAPSFSRSFLLTNLTGHPAVVMPNGFTEKGMPTSITFIGDLYKEAETLSVAKCFQDATEYHTRHPSILEEEKREENKG